MALNIAQANETILQAFLDMPAFPFDTGQLKAHILDGSMAFYDKTIETNLLENPLVQYGFILNNSPTIRRGLKRQGVVYTYKTINNRHFRFMDNFFENDAVNLFEQALNVRRVM